MESPNRKSTQKLARSGPTSPVSSTPRSVRLNSPQQSFKNQSGMRDEAKERQVDKNKQKSMVKESTKPQDIKLHTQQRAIKRALFNYSMATKLYIMEQQKKHLVKIQKMIEEEEIRTLRKEMVPRAQLMPYFDRPFYPQRSTRPLTIPREPNLMSGKCSSCISCRSSMNFSILNTMKPAIK
nr:protein TPX2 [Ipomoea batatas]